jgi:NAD(P)-dependent dehydrogenase (short-subunit alcohol dehydrogenase family)
VCAEADIENLVATAIMSFGKLDCAYNNAGIGSEYGDTVACTNENWERTIDINLRGVWWCMKHEIEAMLKSGGGAIVNCASIAGVIGFPGTPAYCASKHAVLGLTKTAALEYAQKNIRVNAVCPGVIRTPMINAFTNEDAQFESALLTNQPIGRMGTPDEIAQAVVWLCSDAASFVTGHGLLADGGWTAR